VRGERSCVPGVAPAALVVLLGAVSWHAASNLGGTTAGIVYGLAATVTVLVLLPWIADLLGRAPSWVLPLLVAACVAVLAGAFVVGVPRAYHDAMGVGSDRANALDVALTQIARGLYPYSATTYLGNPITPLPGALLLAAPFWWVTGSAAWQNVAWLFLLLPVLNRGWQLRPRPTALWMLTCFGTLEVLRQFLIGDDLISSAVPALAAVVWTLTAASDRSRWALAGAAIVLGVATCTRPHMILVLVVVVAGVGVAAGARRAAIVGGCASLVWVALIVPFLLGGTARFSPGHVAAKVTGDRAVTVGIVVIGLGATALAVVALRVARPSSTEAVGWFCAAVLFAPSVLSLARRLILGPVMDLDLTLGAAAVPFAVWAMASRVAPTPAPSDRSSNPVGPARTRAPRIRAERQVPRDVGRDATGSRGHRFGDRLPRTTENDDRRDMIATDPHHR